MQKDRIKISQLSAVKVVNWRGPKPKSTCITLQQIHTPQTFTSMRILKVDSSIHNKRIKASDLARRSSDDFCETYGHSPLESIAPFQRGEIILGRRVGAGSFSSVYDIQDYNLSAKQSDKYTDEHEQAKNREATAKSVMHGTKYVMKCLNDKLEESDAD